MTIRSRNAIAILENNDCHEIIVSFKRNIENNTYTKITTTNVRNYTTGQLRSGKIKDVLDGPYILVTIEDDYDETISYQDFGGKMKTLYFKKINIKEN
jgi:hypothetical protein